MRKSIALLLGEVESAMNGYTALLNFRYMNLCVKSDVASLLPVTVDYGDGHFDIEKVADVARPNETQLQVFPKSPDLLFAIGKAIAKTHPEFKQEVVDFELSEEEQMPPMEDADEEESYEDKMIVLTMPVVDKDRHDLLITAIDGLHEETKMKIDAYFGVYTQKIAAKLSLGNPEELDEAKKALEGIRDQYKDLAQQYYDNKKQEIEEAYQLYTEQHEAEEQSRKEEEAATNKEAGQGFKLDDLVE